MTPTLLLWNRVISISPPRIASQNSPQRKNSALKGAMNLDGLFRIRGATGVIPAIRREKGGDKFLVQKNDAQKKPFHGMYPLFLQ